MRMAYTQALTVPALFITQLTKRMMAGFQGKNGKLGQKHRPICPALYSMKAMHMCSSKTETLHVTTLKPGRNVGGARSNLAAAVMVNT